MNTIDYQEHLDKHDDNEQCDLCILALRLKVRELEERIKKLEEITLQLRKF